ncbi:MAG TPA: YkgJ family cysteine cluster protein [Candidatus Lokiarchaeia archaeon]|nr:YkgJ family cysteine cluster protein [Candidatus Lokiarchaeia archaeon]
MPPKNLLQCRACGQCCHNHTVLITFRDLREIHQFYPDLRPEDLIVLYDVATEYPDRTILERYHPARLKFEDTIGAVPLKRGKTLNQESQDAENDELNAGDGECTWQAYLGLRFTKNPDGGTVCPLLDETQGRCTIHKHKPMICRTYPHVLYEDGQLARLERVRCNPPWGDPADLPVQDYERIKQTVERAYAAHDRFIEETREWNVCYRGKAVPDFIAFLLRPHADDDFNED